MFGGLNWELKGRAGLFDAGLKVAGLNWFVCMNCPGVTAVEAGGAAWLMLTIWRGPAGPNCDVATLPLPALLGTCLLGCREAPGSGPGGDTNWTLGLKGGAGVLWLPGRPKSLETSILRP